MVSGTDMPMPGSRSSEQGLEEEPDLPGLTLPADQMAFSVRTFAFLSWSQGLSNKGEQGLPKPLKGLLISNWVPHGETQICKNIT